MMRYLIAYLFLLVPTFSVLSQQCDYTLKGRVVDYHDRTPLEGAIIEVTARNRYVQTDADGNFEISALCADVYELQVSHPSAVPFFR